MLRVGEEENEDDDDTGEAIGYSGLRLERLPGTSSLPPQSHVLATYYHHEDRNETTDQRSGDNIMSPRFQLEGVSRQFSRSQTTRAMRRNSKGSNYEINTNHAWR